MVMLSLKKKKLNGRIVVLLCAACGSHLRHMVWYLHSVLCSGTPTQGQKFFQPHQCSGNQLVLGQCKPKQFWPGVFGIWGRTYEREKSFLLLHPNLMETM